MVCLWHSPCPVAHPFCSSLPSHNFGEGLRHRTEREEQPAGELTCHRCHRSSTRPSATPSPGSVATAIPGPTSPCGSASPARASSNAGAPRPTAATPQAGTAHDHDWPHAGSRARTCHRPGHGGEHRKPSDMPPLALRRTCHDISLQPLRQTGHLPQPVTP